MKISDFVDMSGFNEMNQTNKAKLICFFLYKEQDIDKYPLSLISAKFQAFGQAVPNVSRLKTGLIKNKIMLNPGKVGDMQFVPIELERLEEEIGDLWNDNETIQSDSELLDETLFCGHRGFLDKLIVQINSCYKNNCYDACAVLMRRFFEICLILSYEKLNIQNEIKDGDDNYKMLSYIVNNAVNNRILALSRIREEYDDFRLVGNFSAHSIRYNTRGHDIDNIKIKFRVAMEELYHKCGFI